VFGRQYKKNISQALAHMVFRAVGVWILVAASAAHGSVGIVGCYVIIAADLIAGGIIRAFNIKSDEQSRKDWLDRLTNRLFYEHFWERLRTDSREYIDINELFKTASRAAVDDIKQAEADEHVNMGVFDRTTWHWAGGVLSFIGMVFWAVVYYGSAVFIGTGGRF